MEQRHGGDYGAPARPPLGALAHGGTHGDQGPVLLQPRSGAFPSLHCPF